MILAAAPSWEHIVQWTDQAIEEVQFWREHLDEYNGMSLEPAVAAGVISYSDASQVAAAAILSPGPNKDQKVVHQRFRSTKKPPAAHTESCSRWFMPLTSRKPCSWATHCNGKQTVPTWYIL